MCLSDARICARLTCLVRSIAPSHQQYLTDGNDETCWNSDQGSPQHIVLEFEKQVVVQEIQLVFQGGFAGKKCSLRCPKGDILTADSKESWESVLDFEPEDSGMLQTFRIDLKSQRYARQVMLLFESSTDFYGRLIVYKLDLLGLEQNMCGYD